MKGPLHTVGEQAENDGLVNTYFLYSGDNAWAVTTGVALRTRIREIYAIDKLEGMSKTDEFTKALEKSGKQKIDSVVGLVKDPLGHGQTRSPGSIALFWPNRREPQRRSVGG